MKILTLAIILLIQDRHCKKYCDDLTDCTKAPPPPQSNVTSECSEAECDREHLLKDSSPRGEHILSTSLDYFKFSASPEDPAQELTTEEMS